MSTYDGRTFLRKVKNYCLLLILRNTQYVSLLTWTFALLLAQVVYIKRVDEITEDREAVFIGAFGARERFAVRQFVFVGRGFGVEGDACFFEHCFLYEYAALDAHGQGNGV